MRNFRRSLVSCLWLTALLAMQIQAQTSDSRRIAPVYTDEWFYSRIPWFCVLGVLLGCIEAMIWLPRLLPSPHEDDMRRGLKHFRRALALSLLLLVTLVVIDISLLYRFGNRSHTFWDTLFQVGLSWRTFVLLLLSATSFLLVVAVWTRLFSVKCYRYMLIRRRVG